MFDKICFAVTKDAAELTVITIVFQTGGENWARVYWWRGGQQGRGEGGEKHTGKLGNPEF